MLHALIFAIVTEELTEDPLRVLTIGPDTAGNLLEVLTVGEDEGDGLVIHAMKLRPKYRYLLEGDPTQ